MLYPHWLIPPKPYETYEEYLDQYEGFSQVLKAWDMGPDAVLTELRKSGLRGRGGAGFPAASKWTAIRKHPCRIHSVVCNAAEGEPGTFKDRYLIRKNPYALLEGVRIAAHVVGTSIVRVGIKRSFKMEIGRLKGALREMRARGFFQGVDIQIVQGPEEYLFGEEKGLLNVIDGIGPFPREVHYPPYEWGLKPTLQSPNPALVSNAETFAHVPSILHYGASSFRKLGTSDTPGTIIVTVCGDVKRPGVFEVEAGTTLKSVLIDLAGGPRKGRRFKAVLPGISSAVILPGQFDTPLDFGSMQKIGSGLGSAGFIVVDDATSIPRITQAVARFLFVESCGQCPACKMGLRIASRSVDQMFGPPQSRPLTEEKEEDLAEVAVDGALSGPQGNRCYLPMGGKFSIPSLIRAFREEFDNLAGDSSAPGYPIPKIVEYDERAHVFLYDEKQPLKRPDWSYPRLPKEKEKRVWTKPEPEEPPASPCDGLSIPGPKVDKAKTVLKRN